jgi:hypothetical protein
MGGGDASSSLAERLIATAALSRYMAVPFPREATAPSATPRQPPAIGAATRPPTRRFRIVESREGFFGTNENVARAQLRNI